MSLLKSLYSVGLEDFSSSQAIFKKYGFCTAELTCMGERSRELLILVAGDVFCFFLALWLTLFVRYFEWPNAERLHDHFGPFLFLAGVWLFIFYIAGLYDKHTAFLKRMMLQRILYTQVANIIIAAFLFIIIPFGIAPKTNLVIYLFISVLLVIWWRLRIFDHFSPKQRHKAILIANGKEAIELVDEVNNSERYNYTFIRLIDEEAAKNTPDFEAKLLALIEKEKIKIIVANPRGKHIETVLPSIFDLSFLQFEFTFLDFNKVYEDTFDKIPFSSLRYDWFINHVSQSKSLVYDVLKRGVDIFFASMLLLPSMLLFPLVAALIKSEDGGDIFYTTERVGQYNKPLKIYKLRTKNGADTGSSALASELVDTRIGAFLRKTRIDELPQLINVLKGDLSFIGPRPEMPALASVYAEKIPYYNTRHFIKPGLSGWAQIKNYDAPRGGIDIERTESKLSYDLYYLKNRSFMLDIQISLKTLATIVMRTGS